MPPTNGYGKLPTTIEGATSRYLKIYRDNFMGLEDEKRKLSEMADSKIYSLRTKAPKFYEEKLPVLINQAASILQTCNVKTEQGLAKFNHTHRNLLLILTELKKTQPGGDVNFQTERDRILTRDKYRQEQMVLRLEISELEAKEFGTDELGDDETEKHFHKLEEKHKQLTKVSKLLAKMEGESLKEEKTFEFIIPARSMLLQLTQDQRDHFRDQVIESLNNPANKEITDTLDNVEGMLNNLGLDKNKFSKDEWRDFVKEAMHSITSYFRKQADASRDEYFTALLKDKSLMPKEGLILESPDDIPEEQRIILENNEKIAKRKLEEIEDTFNKRAYSEANVPDDEVEEEEVDDEDNIDLEVNRIIHDSAPEMFARIKEEPRDDYDNEAPSDDEIVINQSLADRVESSIGRAMRNSQPEDNVINIDVDDDISDYEDTHDTANQQVSSSGRGPVETSSSEPSSSNTNAVDSSPETNYQQASANLDKFLNEDSDDEEDDNDDDVPMTNSRKSNDTVAEPTEMDCVPLGIVTPKDKIEVIQIDDD